MKIGVVGYGFVGNATAERLGGHELFILDPPKNYHDDISDCDIIFICINETNHEMSNLDKLVDTLVKLNDRCIFVIRTTVIPGTTDYLIQKYNRVFAFMPEFLTQKMAKFDTRYPDKLIIGAQEYGIFFILKNLFGNHQNLLHVKPIEAELGKLAMNTLATIKIVYAEELNALAKVLGAEYSNIYHIFQFDMRAQGGHLQPGLDGYRGADGKCLPKDSNFMVETGKKYNSRMSLTETAVKLNEMLLKFKNHGENNG
jgi:UDPglucose 6-dehydrogenase